MFSPQKKKWQLCDAIEVLANTMAVIILQHINASNEHPAHLKLTMLKVSYISFKRERQRQRENIRPGKWILFKKKDFSLLSEV